jgi:hypothetical protein
MDSWTAPNSRDRAEALPNRGAPRCSGPPDSPDDPPSEPAGSKSKTCRRGSGARTRRKLSRSLKTALTPRTPHEAQAWVRHCGYPVPSPQICSSETAKRFLKRKEPVISVDTKKKERIGNFKNNGRKWRKKGQARKVNVHDFPSLSKGTAIPYGAYDVNRNEGLVNMGITHDTAEFAVESIRRWWHQFGVRHYPGARRLFLCPDSGGSNAARNRAWKYHRQQFSDEPALEIVVGHYPPGTSKWNKIEHQMFSFINSSIDLVRPRANQHGAGYSESASAVLCSTSRARNVRRLDLRIDTRAAKKRFPWLAAPAPANTFSPALRLV